ncbi:MAG: hypothetical protein ABFR53_07555 [Actinomycetota bacterium]
MEDSQDDIRHSFVDAYPRYVASILASRGIEIDDVVADAIVEGAAVLDGLLATFEATDLVDQTSSPLELFREALRPIDRALTLVGAPLPQPGSGATRIAPWDRYALSPGSSQVLGQRAQEAHVSWGLGKAMAFARQVDTTRGPAVGLLCPEGDVAAVVAEVEALHYRTIPLPTDADVSAAVVCADEADADAVVRSVSQRARVVVYGRSIDDLDQIRFASLGATSVVHASALFGRLSEHLPVIG